MSDNNDLKRLAEAFPVDLDWDSNTEPFFNGPSGESLGGGPTGFYCVYGPAFEIDDEQYDGPTYVESCKVDFAKFMVAARDGVLALIAENERLKTLRSSTERDLSQELEVWKHGPSCWSCGDTGDVHDIVGEWRGQCDCNAAKLINAASELDQLKAENEALRKDSERLQSATAFVQKLCDAAVKQPSVATGYLHDILSAMGKEEQS
ncbi:hypothetical protein H097_10502 [Pseudomonas sp. FH4]|uniref:hypothetical protein n=1 Tax=Pseudomonas sp. FH4 TaxID=1284393 RepID=UPI0003DDCDB5|nr:hypothetical protein [Pseudomonas sp. FH4]ETK19283.1 hypothetical protein H097_10502 [Pseudomonas sp. FH4]